MQIAGPVVAIAAIIGVVWLFSGGDEPPADTAASATDPATSTPPDPATAEFARADSLDPALETEPGVTAGEGTLTELKVTTIVTGTGPVVEEGNTVEAHYVGAYYATGEVFQSSWDTGAPAQFDLDGVIAGWRQGLPGVTVGSRVQLDIPFALAYEGVPDRPQGDLRFVVDVLGVRA
jgi:peptidylprolyl isomerase